MTAPRLDALPGGRPFGFAGAALPVRADLERFWHAAAAVPGLERLLDAEGSRPEVRSVLRLRPDEPGRLKWVCVSVQRELGTGFSAVTLFYRARKGRLSVFELPHDPNLPSLPSLDGEVGSTLQYVPRHRYTFRRHRAASASPEIGKVTRRADLLPAWERLGRVWEAAARASIGFAVAEPRGLDRARGVFFQAELPGVDLARRLDATNLAPLLSRAGRVQAELQSLDVRGVPEWRPHELLPGVWSHAELVTLFRPDARRVVEATVDALVATLPRPARTAFCHGDLRCGHLLEHEGLWSVIDLDGCRNGDPCQDVARLLAFLKRDVPYLRDRFAAADGGDVELGAAEAAFLAGHAEAAAVPLDPARLAWYLLAHELHFLARMFKRDLYDELAFGRGLQRLVTLRRLLREKLGGRRRP